MKYMLYLISTLLFLSLMSFSVFGATREVQPGGSIQAGIDAMNPGDTLLIHGGTYTEAPVLPSSKAGREGAETKIVGAPNEKVVIRPKTPNAANTAFWNYANYSVLDNLVINGEDMRNTPSLVMLGEGSGATYHHITVRNTEIKNQHGQGSACLGLSGNVKAHHDLLLEGLKVHDCGLDMTNFNPGGHCLYLGGNQITVQDSELYNCATMGIQLYPEPDRITLRRLKIHHTGANGIISYDRNLVFEDSQIDNFGKDAAHYGEGAGVKQQLNGTSYIRRNKISVGPVGIWTALGEKATVADNTISEVSTNVRNDGTGNVFTNNVCQPASQYCTSGTTPPVTEPPPGGTPDGTYTCTDGTNSFTITLSGAAAQRMQSSSQQRSEKPAWMERREE